MRIILWNEYRQEREEAAVAAVYPGGVHAALAQGLQRCAGELGAPCPAIGVATLDDPEHGLNAEVLAQTDVLVWWGHRHHHSVSDAVADAVARRVWEGMGLVALHSAHFSKPFLRLLGAPGTLRHRKDGERERLWFLNPAHPLAAGLPEHFELDPEEMFGEPFAVPTPDELIAVSWFQGGEVFRSVCAWQRGAGRVLYLRPGHETFPTYHQPAMQRLIWNAVHYAHPSQGWPGVWRATKIPRSDAPEAF